MQCGVEEEGAQGVELLVWTSLEVGQDSLRIRMRWQNIARNSWTRGEAISRIWDDQGCHHKTVMSLIYSEGMIISVSFFDIEEF